MYTIHFTDFSAATLVHLQYIGTGLLYEWPTAGPVKCMEVDLRV